MRGGGSERTNGQKKILHDREMVMLSITLAILALYVLKLSEMAAEPRSALEPRSAFVYFVISICLAIVAALFAAWRDISREG